MSIERAFRAAGVPAAIAKREAPRAALAMVEFDIRTDRRAEHFLAQVLHESGRLRYFEEIAPGAAYEGRRDLGNVHPGDGRRFKGRGPIQLTGRANYRAAGRALGLPLEARPELAADHAVGWRIAAWYWHVHGLDALADRDDLLTITRRINGGTNGLADRRACLRGVRRFDCRPKWAGYTKAERSMIAEYDRLRKARSKPARRRLLRQRMKAQRKRIWRVAQPASRGGDGRGWAYANRRRRYRSLLARSS